CDSPANAAFRLASVFEPLRLMAITSRVRLRKGKPPPSAAARPSVASGCAKKEIDCCDQLDSDDLSLYFAQAAAWGGFALSRFFGSPRSTPATRCRKPAMAEERRHTSARRRLGVESRKRSSLIS